MRLPPHVGPPCIRTRFAAAAGFLLATEGAADLGAGGADVDVGDAAVRTRGGQELLRRLQVVGEDRRRQALRHVVLTADGRSEERRVGQECGSTCSSRLSQYT